MDVMEHTAHNDLWAAADSHASTGDCVATESIDQEPYSISSFHLELETGLTLNIDNNTLLNSTFQDTQKASLYNEGALMNLSLIIK